MLTDPADDYARGYVPFLDTVICLNSRPLIPRVETEYWVEQAIQTIQTESSNQTKSIRVLDLFAGSGCIGIAILKHVPDSEVLFGEIENQHLLTIKKSLTKNNISLDRAHFVTTDVWSAVNGMFDFICANPPYISQKRHTVHGSVLAQEPSNALFADDDGFALIEKTIRGLSQHLQEQGTCWIEHEPFHKERIETLACALNLSVTTHRDQYNIERFSSIKKK